MAPHLHPHTHSDNTTMPRTPRPFSRIAAVTGANKGIGLAIVRNLALQYPSSPLNNNDNNGGPLLIYLCARDKARGENAVKVIENDARLKEAKALMRDGGLTEVRYHGLDIGRRESVLDFVGFLEREHEGGIDVVVNNAGIAMEGFGGYTALSPVYLSICLPACLWLLFLPRLKCQANTSARKDINVVRQTLQCNYYGTLTATRALLPLIRPGGRLVNVSSMSGHLNTKYSPSIRNAFSASKSVDDVTKLMESFTSAVEQGKEKELGWPSAAYAVSKSGITGFTRAVAREEMEKGNGVLVNSCCPGYVSTDMTKHRGAKTVDEGARTPVLLACGDIGGTAGEFVRFTPFHSHSHSLFQFPFLLLLLIISYSYPVFS